MFQRVATRKIGFHKCLRHDPFADAGCLECKPRSDTLVQEFVAKVVDGLSKRDACLAGAKLYSYLCGSGPPKEEIASIGKGVTRSEECLDRVQVCVDRE